MNPLRKFFALLSSRRKPLSIHPEHLMGVLEYQERLARRKEPDYLLGHAEASKQAAVTLDATRDGRVTWVNLEIGNEKVTPRKLHSKEETCR